MTDDTPTVKIHGVEFEIVELDRLQAALQYDIHQFRATQTWEGSSDEIDREVEIRQRTEEKLFEVFDRLERRYTPDLICDARK